MVEDSSTIGFSGANNEGFQLGSNSGQVYVNLGNPRQHTRFKPCLIIPFPRDPDYVARDDILARVDSAFSQSGARVALTGLGGVGKSQLAIEYAYRIRQKSPQTSVFWIHAGSHSRLEASYQRIAERADLPGRNNPGVNIILLVHEWLANRLESMGKSSIYQFLPSGENGSFLVTSRYGVAALKVTGSHKQIIRVGPMNQEEALELFQKKSRRKFGKDQVAEFIQTLDCMPLGITQVATDINKPDNALNATGYLDALKRHGQATADILSLDWHDIRRDNEVSNSILTSWHRSFEQIRTARPSAAQLLCNMSFLDPEWIPVSILRCFKTGLGSDDVELRDDISILVDFYLVEKRDISGVLKMLPLIHFSIRVWLYYTGCLDDLHGKFMTAMHNAVRTKVYNDPSAYRTVFLHIQAAMQPSKDQNIPSGHWPMVLATAALHIQEGGACVEGQQLSLSALEIRDYNIDKQHTDMLSSLHDLASFLKCRGKFNAAEILFRNVLEGRKTALGTNHPETLQSMYELGESLACQGLYKEAYRLFNNLLPCAEKTFGDKHPRTNTTAFKLGESFYCAGRYKEAGELFQRMLASPATDNDIYERLGTINYLFAALNEQGRGEDAIRVLAEGVEAYDKAKALIDRLPYDTDLMTVKGMTEVGSYLFLQDNYEEAEKIYRRALASQQAVLGEDHPTTLNTVFELGVTLHCEKQYQTAEAMYRRALQGQEKSLGKNHPNRLDTIFHLGSTLQCEKKDQAAEAMFRRALDGQEKTLGKSHPDTLRTIYSIGCSLNSRKQYQAAETLLRQALEGQEKSHGRNHIKTIDTTFQLGDTLDNQKQYTAADAMYRRGSEGLEIALGRDNPDTLQILHTLGVKFYEDKRYHAAEVMHRRALEGRERALGKYHRDTLQTIHNLGDTLYYQERYHAAGSTYREVLERRQKVLGHNHPETLETIRRLQRVQTKGGW